MNRRLHIVASVLVGMLVLAGPVAYGDQAVGALTTQGDLDNAVAETLSRDDAARTTITTLLHRADVQSLAEGYGLDLQRAEAAVGTLEGDELQRLSLLATDANAELDGGRSSVTISLVAALLIVIIIILVVN